MHTVALLNIEPHGSESVGEIPEDCKAVLGAIFTNSRATRFNIQEGYSSHVKKAAGVFWSMYFTQESAAIKILARRDIQAVQPVRMQCRTCDQLGTST
jgi:hypothetical protein